MEHAVLGAGGVGGLIGGALAHEGHTVTLIVRQEAVRQTPNRLHVASRVLGDFEAPVAIASGMAEPPDVMWVAVKATQLEAALHVLAADKMAGTLLVPLLNGVDHVATLRAGYPDANVVAGTIRVETERSAPGRIRTAISIRCHSACDQSVGCGASRPGRTGFAYRWVFL